MKKVNIIDLDNVYKDIIKNVKNKRRIYEFEKYKLEYLTLCADIINEGNYKGGYYNIFIIYEPKLRVIMSQIWGDKNRHQEMRQEIRRLVNINSNRINDITKGKADKDVLEVLGCCFIGVLFSSALYEILYEDQYSENYIVDRFMEYVNFSIEKINKKV